MYSDTPYLWQCFKEADKAYYPFFSLLPMHIKPTNPKRKNYIVLKGPQLEAVLQETDAEDLCSTH